MNSQKLKKAFKAEQEKTDKLEQDYQKLLSKLDLRTKKLEEELSKRKKIEKELKQIINLNPNYIFAKNYAGEFTLINDSLAEAFGSTPEKIIGKTDADFAKNKEEAENFRRDDLRVMNTKKELVIPEEILTNAQGNKVYLRTVKRAIVDEDGKTTHLLGVASDITDQVINRQKLSRLAAIVESSNDAIACISFDGLITCWNKAAESMFGYSGKEAIGKHIEFICPDEFIGIAKQLLKKVLNGEKIKNLHLKGLKSDGTIIDIELTISAVKDDAGEITATSAIARDITERIKSEKELEIHRKELSRLVRLKAKKLSLSQLRLRKAEKLAALGTLASGIAHEINNPIGAIVLTAENTLESIEQCLDEKTLRSHVKRGNKKIIKNAHRCSLIIKEALQFAKKNNTTKKFCDFNQLIENAVNLAYQYESSKLCSVTMQLDRTIPSILVNPLEIEQLLVNIIQNAFESSESPVLVNIKASIVNKNKLEVRISDDGNGIPKDKLNRAFEAFYSSKKGQGGTGLGLSIAKQIVNSHKGKISLKSSNRKGTTCLITIPLLTKKRAKIYTKNSSYLLKEKEAKKELIASSRSAADHENSTASLSAARATTVSSGTPV